MRNKVVIIIPYFGKFPNYFDFWEKSAVANKDFDFLIFTDNSYKSYKNITFVKTTFDDFKDLLQKQVEFPINLKSPYKLCDFKPLYGCALQKYIHGYDFWGYCDLDLIFGDLKKFITPDVLNKYDKIYSFGHLTLLRNNDDCNYLWRYKHHLDAYRYDEAFKTPYSCNFDEMLGINQIAKAKNIRYYQQIDFADIDYTKYNFFLIGKQKKVVPGVFVWKEGKLFYHWLENGKDNVMELAYAHFQKRPMKVIKKTEQGDQFIMIPNSIVVDKNYYPYLKNQVIKTAYPYWEKRKKEEFWKNKRNHSLQQHVYRSLFRKYWRKVLDHQNER